MKRISALLAALALVCALNACRGDDGNRDTTAAHENATTAAHDGDAASDIRAGSDGDAAGETVENTKVAVFYYNFSDAYITSVRTALDAELNAAGVVYQNFDANGSQDTQNACIDAALGDDYKILVVNMVNSGSSDTAKEIIEKADGEGARIIFFDRAIEEKGNEGAVLGANDNICFIGSELSQEQNAESMAKAIAGMVAHAAANTPMDEGIAAVAAADEIYGVAEDVDNKLYVLSSESIGAE